MKPLFLCSALWLGATATQAASSALATPASTPKVQVATRFERVEALPNGLTFVSHVDHTSPRVAFSLLVRAGASEETPATAGWRRLYAGAVARGVPKGAERLVDTSDGQGLARLSERAGGEAGVSVGDDAIEFYAVGDSQHADQLLDLLLAVWQTPRLSDQDISASRARLASQLDAQDLDLAAQTSAALRAQEFVGENGEPLSYGLNDVGTTQSQAALTNERVRELGARTASSGATLSAVGDVDLDAVRARLSALAAPSVAPSPAPRFRAPQGGKPALVVRDLPVQTAWVFVSYPLGRVSAEDAPTLRLLSAALADVPNARLTRRLLATSLVQGAPPALSLSSQFVRRRDGSELLISAQTAPSRVESVKNAILDEVRKLRETPLSPSEFAAARDFARGDWALSRQSLRDRAFLVGQSQTLSGSPDALWPQLLSQTSPKKAQAVARRTLGTYVVALVMPG